MKTLLHKSASALSSVLRRAAVAAGLVGSALLPQAQATAVVIDFESQAPSLYFPLDTFSQSGFTMTVDYDFGLVDVASSMDPAVAPTGNATQFYTQTNDGGLIIQRDNGGRFNLDGFSTAFVPLSPASTQKTVIAAVGVFADGSSTGVAWDFDRIFRSFNNPLDFSYFTDVVLVEFFACSYDPTTGSICASATQNNAQFAIDDIRVSFAPEPSTLALMPLFMLGLAWRSRRTSSLKPTTTGSL